ncbi:MAG: MBL fold metallo-hydrolase [Alphaproteobacteria bacterium]
MKVRILGCGPSYGVPSLSRGFGECDSKNPKNVRTRTAMLLKSEAGNFVFDTGPEIREQLIAAGSPKIDAVLYTHAHYDHMGGAEDLRKAVTGPEDQDTLLPVYLKEDDEREFAELLYFAFPPFAKKMTFDVHVIKPYIPFQINGLEIMPIKQYHSSRTSIGYRIGDFAYSTDVKQMDEKGFEALKGIKIWILGVTTPTENNKHINVKEALKWIELIRPDRAFFTHMGTRMDYETLCKTLPAHVRPVYDGMEIDV